MIHTAFSKPDRTLTARITINGTVYGPDVISKIEFKRGVSLADQFEIGTAYSQVVSFDFLDQEGTLLTGLSLGGKRAKVEIGVLDGATFVYKDMGEYILDPPERVQKMLWSITGADDMDIANNMFSDAQTYPRTITQIYQYAVAQMGMTTDTVTFPNSSISITTKPTWYDMTIREVLADIAEIAAGYCFIENGKVRIKSIVQDTTTAITSENIKDFRRLEQLEKGIKINKLVIMQQGAEDHTTGTGVNPYFIKDNVFIQGNPGTFSAAIFTALNGVQFIPGELDFNGNPTEILNGWVNIEFLGVTYKFFPTSREISFNGGMSEKWISNFLDNLPHKEEIKDLVRTIKKTSARLLVLDDEISAKVETAVEDAPIYTWIKYADDALGNGLSNDPSGKKYLGLANGKTTATESLLKSDYTWSKIEGPQGIKGDTGQQGLQGLQGNTGNQGIPGNAGANGTSSYTHIAYANSFDGVTDFSLSDPNRDYIGMYVDSIITDSTTPSKYKWTKIIGEDGSQGIQGPVGSNGQTPYLHIAYATNITGTTGFSTTVSAGKTHIGQYTDFIAADSTDPVKYKWTLIKGDQGIQGPQGNQGNQGIPGPVGNSLYTWIKYADSPTTGMNDLPAGKLYIGLAYNKTTATESSTYADYSWSLVKGDQGNQGIQGPVGQNGATLYTWIKYADTKTTGMSDDPTGKKYLGIAYNQTNITESVLYGDYSWSLIEGPQGSQGIQGPQGPTSYTWVKYADTPTTGMNDLPDGKTYIGLAYNKTTATESLTYADYSWSLIKGAQGIQGVQGPNGVTYYTWVKYADTPTTGMNDLPDGKKYMGIAYNKTTATESSVYADYSWSLIKGQGLVSASIQYYRSTSSSSQTGGSWLDDAPAFLVNTFMWTRLKSVWENPVATTYSTPVLDQAWGKLSNLDSRTTSAEQKITPTAITQTVEANSTVLATKAEVALVDEAWTAKFSKIGGTNLIPKSEVFEFPITEYNYVTSIKDAIDPNGGTSKVLSLKSTTKDGLNYLRFTELIKRNGVYTFSCWMRRPPGGGSAVQMNIGVGMDWTSKTIAVSDTWQYITVTANANLDVSVYNFVQIKMVQFEGVEFYMYHPKLEEGSVATSWTSAEEEFESGITKIGKDGINVGVSNSETNTQLSYDGLRVYDGETVISSFGDKGAVIPVLTVGEVISDTVVQSLVGDTYSVGVGKNFLSLQEAFASLFGNGQRVIKRTLRLEVYGTLNEDVNLTDIVGGSLIISLMSGATIYGNWTVDKCQSTIYIYSNSGGVLKTWNSRQTGLLILDSPTVLFEGINFTQSSSSYVICISAGSGSRAYVTNCDFTNYSDTCMYAPANGEITSLNTRGSNCGFSIYAGAGGKVYGSGTIVNSTSDTMANPLGFATTKNLTKTPSTYSPPAITSKTFVQKFTSATFKTMSNDTYQSSTYGASSAQNKWSGMEVWTRGYITLGSGINSFIADATSVSAVIRLRRKNSSHGYASLIPPTPYNFVSTMSGANRGSWTGWGSIAMAYIGDGKTLTLGSNTYSNYAIWDAIEIEVTATKNV